MVYWTDSSAYASNPDLVALLDTLYRHTAGSSFRNREIGELGWARETTILNSKKCVIPNAHAEMYEPEINRVADDCWTDKEVAEFYSNGNIKLYRKVAEQSGKVKSLAHKWIEARNRLHEVSPVQDSRYYRRNSSEVLLQLSNMLINSLNII